MKTSQMTEQQATRAYGKGEITLEQYHDVLRRIGSSRHAADVRKTKDRRSMSSSKWR